MGGGEGRAKLRLSRGFSRCTRLITSPPHFSHGSVDHLTAPNKVLNLRVTHFPSDDANDRANRDRLERMI
jgi:hypothetical protein